MVKRKRILQILSRSSGEVQVSRRCDHFLATLILLNLFAVSLESIDSLSRQYCPFFILFEIFSVNIFGIEYLLRIWTVADNEASRFKTVTGRRLEAA